jgi:hypothetical protein
MDEKTALVTVKRLLGAPLYQNKTTATFPTSPINMSMYSE